MGMSRHDAYYEPDDYDDRSDEIEERTWELMKKGGEYDPKNVHKVLEALGEISVDTANALQDCIDTDNYELIGRKIMSIAFDYLERYATEQAERGF
jgi:hypothetical protein